MGRAMFELAQLVLKRGGKPITQGLDWQVAAGQVWGVLGANGAGKSSLLLCMAGLLPADMGEIQLLGRPLKAFGAKERACHLGFLAQDQTADLPIRLRDWLLLSRYPHQGLWGLVRPQDQARVDEVLAQTQLLELAGRYTCELSGGERQRMALAGLLVQEAPWLLLDEPTNHLDLHHQMSLLPQLIEASCGRGGALVMSLHDVNLAAQFCSHCLLLFGGGEVLAGPVDQVLTASAISRIYRHPIDLIEGPSARVFVPRRLD